MNATYQSKKQKMADERCCYSKEWIEAKVNVLKEELKFASESRRPELEEQFAYYQNKLDNFSEDVIPELSGEAASFEESFYKKHFAAYVKKENSFRREKGRYDFMTLEDYRSSKYSSPRESVFQVGKNGDAVTKEDLSGCFVLFLGKLEKYHAEKGLDIPVLDWTVNDSEHSSVPYVCMRYVFIYTDDDGVESVNMTRALEAAGFGLPEPDKPESRKNNPMMKYTSDVRRLWTGACCDYGFDIDNAS